MPQISATCSACWSTPRLTTPGTSVIVRSCCCSRSTGCAAAKWRHLRLDQIDWAARTLRLFRLKRRQPQIYPLVPSAAEALARHIDTVRPLSSCPEVFLCMHAPRRPLKAGSIYDVANRRLVALGIDAAHRGGHALRHACASRLLAEGLSIKEIGDHLGHRSAASTSIYAKNMQALRDVGAFDVGGLLMLTHVVDA
ncbi:integrase [Bradyrhizobium sp. i1.3.1]